MKHLKKFNEEEYNPYNDDMCRTIFNAIENADYKTAIRELTDDKDLMLNWRMYDIPDYAFSDYYTLSCDPHADPEELKDAKELSILILNHNGFDKHEYIKNVFKMKKDAPTFNDQLLSTMKELDPTAKSLIDAHDKFDFL